MKEDLNEYGISILEDTKLMMEPESDADEAFTQAILEQITDLIDCEQPVVRHCVIRNKAQNILGEIHGYAESTNGEVLYLFYSLYNPHSEITSKNNTEVQPAINRAQGFYKKAVQAVYDDFDESSPEYEVLKFFYENVSKHKTINIKILSNHILNNIEIKKISILNKPVYLDVWDIRKLYGNTHTMGDHIPINIDFTSEEYNKYKIMYLQMESEQFGYRCIQALFPAKLICDLYEKYNTNLLYNNVRYFLGLAGSKENKPNAAMLDTLRTENEMFLAYNNGITALALGVEGIPVGEKTNVTDVDNTASVQYISMGELKNIIDFRIVNGGQTCATIFNARQLSKGQKDPSKKVNLLGVYVQVKLIISDNIEDYAGKITKSSNFQNKIKIPDFTVSNDFNVKLEKLSRNTVIPNKNNDLVHWFFERLRGQYDETKKSNKTKHERDLFESTFPKKLKFTKEDMAKVWCAWEGFPHDAVKGASTAYSQFLKKVIPVCPVPDEHFYKELIAKLIIFRFLKDRPENKVYGNGKATVMAYALALLKELSHGKFNLMKIWENQSVSDDLKVCLNTLCDGIFQILSSKATDQNSTILSYGKTQGAFDMLLKQHWSIDNNILGL